jgi:hypothetical protein
MQTRSIRGSREPVWGIFECVLTIKLIHGFSDEIIGTDQLYGSTTTSL